MSEFTAEQITGLVRRYIKETLANDERWRALAGPSASGDETLEGMTFLEGSNMKSEESNSLLKSVSRWFQNQDHSLMDSVTKKLLNDQECESACNNDPFMREISVQN
jgi:hypothetical protein